MSERTAPLEFRASGRTLTGEAIRYGQQATDRPERFEPGVFQPLGAVSLNLQHDRSITLAETGDRLTVTDTPRALEVRAELRDGAALTMLHRGSLRGLSVEFRAIDEHRDSSGVRVIEKASLEAIGLVDAPSYSGRLEVRRGGFWGISIRSRIPTGARARCECGGDAACKWAVLIPEAVEEMMDAAFEGALADLAAEIEGRAAREVIACWGRYDRPLASVSRGTLRRSGRYGVEIDLPDDENGRAVLAAHEAAGVIIQTPPRRRPERSDTGRRHADVQQGRGAGVHREQHRRTRRLAHTGTHHRHTTRTRPRGTWTEPTVAVNTAQPFPPQPGARIPVTPSRDTGAVTLTASELAAETGADLPRAERLLQVAAQVAVDYAPQAPTVLLNEAVIRFAGYLAGSDYGAVRTEHVGPLQIEHHLNHAVAFRNCGAAALLTRHKRRRAGSIG